jgi:hypothetical protein
MGKHHSDIVGSSTAKLRLLCNASIDEGQGVPEEPWNVYAATGTALHTIVEEAISNDMSDESILQNYVGKHMEDVRITRELIEDKAFPALDFFWCTVPARAKITLEKFLPLPEVHKDSGGTGDVIFESEDSRRAGVIDWKFGDGVTVAEDGEYQIKFVLAAAINGGLLPADPKMFYEGYIFQPSAKLAPEQYVTSFEFTLRDIDDFVEQLADAVNGSRKHTTGAHCYGCKGKIRCKAYRALLAAAVDSDIRGLDTHQLGAALDMVPALNKYIKELKEIAYRNAIEGRIPVGYKLEPSLGDRAWKDENAAWGALGRLGLPADVRTVKKTISPAQAEKALKELQPDPDALARFWKKHVIRPETGQSLKKLADGELAADDFERLALALEAK